MLALRDRGVPYTIDLLSDGERAGLLLICSALVQPTNSFLLIDEPERHLNPSISGPLISAIVRARPDIGYVLATHDLQLIEWLHPSRILHVRDSNIISAPGSPVEAREYSISVLDSKGDIPEELRYALLGSRRALLLVEGTNTSEDKVLYSLIYPDWNVVAKGGCDTIISSVSALEGNGAYHWLKVAGIVDRDGREQIEILALTGKGIFTLPVPTIENIFCVKEIVRAMAQAMPPRM